MEFIETRHEYHDDGSVLELLVPSEILPTIVGFSDSILERWDLKQELQDSFLESLTEIFGTVTHDQQGSYLADTGLYEVGVLFTIDDDEHYNINIYVQDEYSDDENYIYFMLQKIVLGKPYK
jgi:hypothetical protein